MSTHTFIRFSKRITHYLWKPKAQKSHVEIDYSPLWFRHNFYSPYYPYRYPVPVRVRVEDNSGTPAKERN